MIDSLNSSPNFSEHSNSNVLSTGNRQPPSAQQLALEAAAHPRSTAKYAAPDIDRLVKLARSGTINCSPAVDKPLVSVIIPVYNVAEFLDTAVGSVVRQTLDFVPHIELILVNDGSTDNSQEICVKYAHQYPHNVVHLSQPNAGVSAARNLGLESAQGQFIAFLDGDDKFGHEALSNALQTFLTCEHELDFVSMRTWFFGEREGQHHLNYRLGDGEVVDVSHIWNKPQMSVHSTLIKGDVGRSERFNLNLSFAEDALYVSSLLAKNSGRYGISWHSRYYYRKRDVAGSAIDGAQGDPRWYLDVFDHFHSRLQRLASKYPDRALYLSMVSGYELQWRYRDRSLDRATGCLTPEQVMRYIDELNLAIMQIDDRAIMAQRHLSREAKAYWYLLKHGPNWGNLVDFELESPTGCLTQNEFDSAINSLVQIDSMSAQPDGVRIEGRISNPFFPHGRVEILSNDRPVQVTVVARPLSEVSMLGQLIASPTGFEVLLGAKRAQLSFHLQVSGQKRIDISPRYARSSKWNNFMRSSYLPLKGAIVTRTEAGLVVNKYSKIRRLVCEIKYLVELTQQRQLKVKAPVWRLAGYVTRCLLGSRALWLISDRTNAAGDNAEFVFRHAQKVASQDGISRLPRFVFAIRKSSPDYQRMKKYGPVVAHGSVAYKVLFLAATHVVSSHADDYVSNPFGRQWWRYSSMYRAHFIFLQHGVMNNDMSRWLNRYNKDISLLVSTMESEHKSMLNGRYAYAEHQLLLSGLPRFDALESKTERVIALMPTWRQPLAGTLNVRTGIRRYNRDFSSSEYFTFYNQLISDPDLMHVLDQHQYQLEFYIHPAFAAQFSDFTAGPAARVMKYPHDYRGAIERSAAIITDYSSVAFDFAYLGKPTIYTHFDYEQMLREHIYDSDVPRFFIHEQDGFGPVTRDFDHAKSEIIALVERNCEIDPEYLERINRAFRHRDRNNTQRVFDAISALPRKAP